MNSDEKYWLGFFSLVGVTIIAIVVTIVAYNVSANIAVANMVRAGADPIVASCAISMPQDRTVCIAAYQRRPK